VLGTDHIVASADQLATQAAMATFERGGNAVDAAIACNAAMAVVAPHLCGLGGDLFALVHTGDEVVGLDASGRAGSGADAESLRAEHHRVMPMRHDVRAVTVPGCVDGWLALHEQFATLELRDVLAPAIRLAAHGFPASPLLVGSLALLDDDGRQQLDELVAQATAPGAVVRRPGVALVLQAIADRGRNAFYQGPFGEGLIALGDGLFDAADLERVQATWVVPLSTAVFGAHLATIGPASQGYLALATCALAESVGLPDDPADPGWAHILIEAATAAGHDRPAVLHEGADGADLLAEVSARSHMIDVDRASPRWAGVAGGDTTYLCTAEAGGLAVSLIQSNASGFGSWLVEPTTGINLHNRGLGFSLDPGHPAELRPGARPPHTLSPAMATGDDGALVAVLGTMGGDGQPQIVAQLAARILLNGDSPARAVDAGRWVLRGPETGFDTWTAEAGPSVLVEGHAPAPWRTGLIERGHRVDVAPAFDSSFGHAHVIVAEPAGVLAGAADPRARIGAAAAM